MSPRKGPFVKIKLRKTENQAFAEFKYLEKTNYMVFNPTGSESWTFNCYSNSSIMAWLSGILVREARWLVSVIEYNPLYSGILVEQA